MSIKYLLIAILACSSLSNANEDQRTLVSGKIEHSFVDGEFVSVDGRRITIFDGAALEESQLRYLNNNIYSGNQATVLINTEAIKVSWIYEDKKISDGEFGKQDQLIVNNNLLFMLGTKLFSWQEDYFIIQIGSEFYHLLSSDLSDAEKARVRQLQNGEKFNILVGGSSIVPLIDPAFQRELEATQRKERILIFSDATIVVGRVHWFPSQQIGSIQSKGYVFIFDKKSLEDSQQRLIDLHGKNISLRIPSKDILAIFNNEGLVDLRKFVQHTNEMQMIVK